MQYFAHHNITRKAIVGFMDLFNEIYIEKYREGKASQLYKVPIQFANREKFVEIMQSTTNFADHDGSWNSTVVEIDTILPRVSVNMLSMNYSPERHVPKRNRLVGSASAADTSGNYPKQFVPTPYNLDIELAILSKTMDDALQILEQIIPFFSPSKSINIQVFDNFDSESVPVILQSVTPTIEEEISNEDERMVSFLLNFVVKINYYLPRKVSKKVKQVNTNFYIIDERDDVNDKFIQYQQNAVLDTILPDTSTANIYELMIDGTTVQLRAVSQDFVDPMTGQTYKIFYLKNGEIAAGAPAAGLPSLEPVDNVFLADTVMPDVYYELTVENGAITLTTLTVVPTYETFIELYDATGNVLYHLTVENGSLKPVIIDTSV